MKIKAEDIVCLNENDKILDQYGEVIIDINLPGDVYPCVGIRVETSGEVVVSTSRTLPVRNWEPVVECYKRALQYKEAIDTLKAIQVMKQGE